MGQYSYSQPSSSRASLPTEDYGFDAAEVSSVDRRRPVNLFGNSGKNGIPERCVCGLTAVTHTSTTELNPGRIFFGCKNHKVMSLLLMFLFVSYYMSLRYMK